MIKTIIFDFDDTLYVGDVWGKKWADFLEKFAQYIVRNESTYKKIMKKYDLTNSLRTQKEVCIMSEKEGFGHRRFKKFLKHNIYEHATKDVEVISADFLKELSKSYHLYVVSLSTQNYLKHYSKLYGIDEKCFKKMYSVNLCAKNKSKAVLLKKIMKKEKCLPEEMLMVGDSLKSDIEPAKQLSINTLQFNGDFNQIYEYFTENKILDCKKYIK